MATSAKTGPTAVGPSSTKSSASKSATTKGTTPAANQPKAPGSGRLFIGLMIFYVASLFFQTGLTWADVTYHWQLEKKLLFTLPVLGNVTALTLIFIVLLVGVMWALYRFKVLPSGKDLAAQRAASIAARQGNASGAKGGATVSKGATGTKAVAGAKTTTGKATTAGKPGLTGKNAIVSTEKPEKQLVETTPENDALYEQAKAQQRALARKRSARR